MFRVRSTNVGDPQKRRFDSKPWRTMLKLLPVHRLIMRAAVTLLPSLPGSRLPDEQEKGKRGGEGEGGIEFG